MKRSSCQLQRKLLKRHAVQGGGVYTGYRGNAGRSCGTARSHNPISYSFFTGQDIKSDGFSIETCKIMVDLLDVSFKAVPGCYCSACSR